GAAALPAEITRRRPRSLRRLARPAGGEDAGRAYAPALRERAPDRGVPRRARGRRAGLVPRAARPSRPRSRGAADDRLRRDDLVPRRLRGGRYPSRRRDEGLEAGREPRWRREPDRAAGADDSCLDGKRAVRGAVESRPALRRDRVGRRPRRRPRARACDDCRKSLLASAYNQADGLGPLHPAARPDAPTGARRPVVAEADVRALLERRPDVRDDGSRDRTAD